MTDLTALWDETATEEEVVQTYQHLVNTGTAWRLEGSVGRTAMGLIENGEVVLGHKGFRDYWGNYVPSRYEVEAGTKGSVEYAQERGSIGPYVDLDAPDDREVLDG